MNSPGLRNCSFEPQAARVRAGVSSAIVGLRFQRPVANPLQRGKMEQLGAVFRQIQIQPLLLKVVAKALMFLAAEQIFHPPIPLGQTLDCE